MKLTWSAFALSDRDAIFTYIEAENPSAAILVDERIVAAVRRLIDFPASGRVGRIAGTRELVIKRHAVRRGVCNYRNSGPYSSRPPWRAGMARHFANEIGFVLDAENQRVGGSNYALLFKYVRTITSVVVTRTSSKRARRLLFLIFALVSGATCIAPSFKGVARQALI